MDDFLKNGSSVISVTNATRGRQKAILLVRSHPPFAYAHAPTELPIAPATKLNAKYKPLSLDRSAGPMAKIIRCPTTMFIVSDFKVVS